MMKFCYLHCVFSLLDTCEFDIFPMRFDLVVLGGRAFTAHDL